MRTWDRIQHLLNFIIPALKEEKGLQRVEEAGYFLRWNLNMLEYELYGDGGQAGLRVALSPLKNISSLFVKTREEQWTLKEKEIKYEDFTRKFPNFQWNWQLLYPSNKGVLVFLQINLSPNTLIIYKLRGKKFIITSRYGQEELLRDFPKSLEDSESILGARVQGEIDFEKNAQEIFNKSGLKSFAEILTDTTIS